MPVERFREVASPSTPQGFRDHRTVPTPARAETPAPQLRASVAGEGVAHGRRVVVNGDLIVIQADPVSVPIGDGKRIRFYFGVEPATVIEWHRTRDFPIMWNGRGAGRKGHVPMKQAREWFRKQIGE
jgi:hypothetical protein